MGFHFAPFTTNWCYSNAMFLSGNPFKVVSCFKPLFILLRFREVRLGNITQRKLIFALNANLFAITNSPLTSHAKKNPSPWRPDFEERGAASAGPSERARANLDALALASRREKASQAVPVLISAVMVN